MHTPEMIQRVQAIVVPKGAIHPRDIRLHPEQYFKDGFSVARNGAISGYMLVTSLITRLWGDPEFFNCDNRRAVENRIEDIVTSCEHGQFETTHQGGAFDVNDITADGGKRFTAIARSNTDQMMMITVNQPLICRRYVDGIQSRPPTTNVAGLTGQPKYVLERVVATNYHLFRKDRPNADRLTDSIQILGMPAINWATESIPKAGHLLSRAPLSGAVIFASGRDRKRLGKFNDEVNTKPQSGSAQALRSLILAHNKEPVYGDRRREEGVAYLIAAHAFMTGKQCPKLTDLTISNPSYEAARRYFNTHGVA